MERTRPETTRCGVTHRFALGNNEKGITVYVTVNFYSDTGKVSEIFLTTNDGGHLVRSLLDIIAITTSIALQHGIPLQAITKQWVGQRFDPDGIVIGSVLERPFAASLIDYLAKYLLHVEAQVVEAVAKDKEKGLEYVCGEVSNADSTL